MARHIPATTGCSTPSAVTVYRESTADNSRSPSLVARRRHHFCKGNETRNRRTSDGHTSMSKSCLKAGFSPEPKVDRHHSADCGRPTPSTSKCACSQARRRRPQWPKNLKAFARREREECLTHRRPQRATCAEAGPSLARAERYRRASGPLAAHNCAAHVACRIGLRTCAQYVLGSERGCS